MPVSRRTYAQPSSNSPRPSEVNPQLRPYAHHGVDLSENGSHAVAECPFCAKEGKFSVDSGTGLWRCWSCGTGTARGGGNALVFIRLLYEQAAARTSEQFRKLVATDRRLHDPATVAAWGVAQALDGAWLVPGYGSDGTLDQVYRRTYVDGKWLLLPTPGVWPEGKVHALHLPTGDFKPERNALVICEGPWDGMALWEIKREVWGSANIVAVPGCNVWRDDWTTALCEGKAVTLLFDSDHPRVQGERSMRSGWDGMYRVAKKLSGHANSVQVVMWGPDGYDPSKPSGWDVRDELTTGNYAQRCKALVGLLGKLAPAPSDWFSAQATIVTGTSARQVEAQDCSAWKDCETAWADALQWRQDLSDALAVCLAVCASTQQGGNQLFVQLVGSAGSGKTTICDGLLISPHCHHLEHLTGFHSGWKLADDQSKDCSLIARINGKTLITPEADVLVSSPRFAEIMGQQRRIFDGKSGATYKNTDQDTLYVGLRTPWIMAGTYAMLDHDQSHLGDRFLRFIIPDPTEAEKRVILRRALRSERVAMLDSANGTAGSLVDPKTRLAHALTGGYVNWLRAHVEEQLSRVEVDQVAEDYCIDLAELSADLRARPNEDKRKLETHETKELPTRLARQNIRLASCLAVVLNKQSVDTEVLRITRKVALDTAHGHSLNIVQWLCSINPKVGGKTYQEGGGIMNDMLQVWTGMSSERLQRYMMFLMKIGVAEWRPIKQSHGAWALTERVYDLYLQVMRT